MTRALIQNDRTSASAVESQCPSAPNSAENFLKPSRTLHSSGLVVKDKHENQTNSTLQVGLYVLASGLTLESLDYIFPRILVKVAAVLVLFGDCNMHLSVGDVFLVDGLFLPALLLGWLFDHARGTRNVLKRLFLIAKVGHFNLTAFGLLQNTGVSEHWWETQPVGTGERWEVLVRRVV